MYWKTTPFSVATIKVGSLEVWGGAPWLTSLEDFRISTHWPWAVAVGFF